MFLNHARHFVRRTWRARHTLWLMIERELMTRFSGSLAGLLWSVIHPVMLVIIYTLIFSLIFGNRIENVPFPLWLFAALLPWMMFSEIMRNSAGVIEKNRSLVTRTGFKPEILPLTTIGTALVGHLIGFCVLVAFLLLHRHPIGIYVLTLPVYLCCLINFSLGISWLLSSLNVFIRDISQIISIILQLWFYLCPIIYPPETIPDKYMYLMRLNPMYFITEGYRRAILYNKGILFADLLYFTAVSLVLMFIGSWTFRRLKKHFAEVL